MFGYVLHNLNVVRRYDNVLNDSVHVTTVYISNDRVPTRIYNCFEITRT